jgi:hypothetical protein
VAGDAVGAQAVVALDQFGAAAQVEAGAAHGYSTSAPTR